jgi:hypothetical protein
MSAGRTILELWWRTRIALAGGRSVASGSDLIARTQEGALGTSQEAGERLPAHNQPTWPGWTPGMELTTLEEVMLAQARVGDRVDGGEGPVDETEMLEGGKEEAIRAAVLRHLLIADEWPGDARGVWLRGVRITGHLDLEAATLRFPLSLQNCYLDAKDPASLGGATALFVSLEGCRLAGISGEMFTAKQLDLSDTIFTGAVSLIDADIAGQLFCRGTKLTGRDENGNAMVGEGMKVGGEVFLSEGFTAEGAVRLAGADIGGQLSCRGATLTGRDKDGDALVADGMTVRGDVFLSEGFTAEGAVRLAGADIGGQLSCRGATLTGRDEYGNALVAERMKVGSDVLLDEAFTAGGAVRLAGTHITGALRCGGAQLAGRDKNGNALYGERMKVGSDVLLDKALTTSGAVCLLSADIAGQFSCGAQLNGRDKNGNALHGEGIKEGYSRFPPKVQTNNG